jgi:hypothetical protein
MSHHCHCLSIPETYVRCWCHLCGKTLNLSDTVAVLLITSFGAVNKSLYQILYKTKQKYFLGESHNSNETDVLFCICILK